MSPVFAAVRCAGLALLLIVAGEAARAQPDGGAAASSQTGVRDSVEKVQVLGLKRLAPRLLRPLRRVAALDTALQVPEGVRSLSWSLPPSLARSMTRPTRRLRKTPGAAAPDADPPADSLSRTSEPNAEERIGPLGGGEAANRPYRQEPSVYYTLPAVRYTRVEGAVLGTQRPPAGWTGGPLLHPYGQVSYAFGLEEVRVVGGLEVRLRQSDDGRTGLKAGLHAGRTTATSDSWKRSWASNSVSALLYGDDLFNYYGVRQATAYLVRRFSPQMQVSTGVRWARHTTLRRTTSWSVLDRSTLDANPPADEGEAVTALVAVEGGLLHRHSEYRSTGTIGRLFVEIGAWDGSDLRYNRLIADVQTYQPIAPQVNLNLRARAGMLTHDAPSQMQFRLDGVHGLRSYRPTRPAGQRMVLGGVQLTSYVFPGTDVSSVHLSGFADIGWSGGGSAFQSGDAFGFVGGTLFLFDRLVGLEVTWPLHRPTGWQPDVSFKLNPLG